MATLRRNKIKDLRDFMEELEEISQLRSVCANALEEMMEHYYRKEGNRYVRHPEDKNPPEVARQAEAGLRKFQSALDTRFTQTVVANMDLAVSTMVELFCLDVSFDKNTGIIFGDVDENLGLNFDEFEDIDRDTLSKDMLMKYWLEGSMNSHKFLERSNSTQQGDNQSSKKKN